MASVMAQPSICHTLVLCFRGLVRILLLLIVPFDKVNKKKKEVKTEAGLFLEIICRRKQEIEMLKYLLKIR